MAQHYLYISVGDTGAMFTLREREVFLIGSSSRVHDFHHCNLGQDPEMSWQKAIVYSLTMGVQLKTRREELDQDLRTISRMKKEEREERARLIKEEQDRYAEARLAHFNELKARIDSGIFPFGKYAGKKFEEAASSYLRWMYEQDVEPDTILEYLRNAVMNKIGEIPSDFNTTAKVGEIGKRIELDVTVFKSTGFWKEGFNGQEYVYVTTFITSARECLVVMSSTFKAEEGKQLKIRGTVKDHREYKGQMQTIINRVKAI